MDINIIEKAIEDLENSEETEENVTLLSSLYIVRKNLNSSKFSQSSHDNYTQFPYYEKYISTKRKYQLNQTTEGEVIQDMKNMCRELKMLVSTLYCNTDMNKERLCIRQMLQELSEKFCS